ncbi:MAG: lasso RiPP family leader peptide-containing protein [Acidobacteria bacterium]|nr:lasso RiPP family leader peptide-containing protein [Acidobacteriota bacterium]
MEQKGQENTLVNSKVATGKLTYVTPTLVEYGSVAKLTAAGSPGGNDGSPGFMNPCL